MRVFRCLEDAVRRTQGEKGGYFILIRHDSTAEYWMKNLLDKLIKEFDPHLDRFDTELPDVEEVIGQVTAT